MTDLTQAARMALEALQGVAQWVEKRPDEHPWDAWQRVEPAITALRAAIQAQGEPVAWYDGAAFYDSEEAASMACADMAALRPLYATPQPPKVEAQGEPVAVPAGLSRSDAEFWLSRRAQIIEACRAQGFTIVTTAHGTHLMRLGQIEAQSATPQPPQGWVLVPARLLEKTADVLEEATTYTGSESWSPSMTDELLALRQAWLAAAKKEPQA